MSSAKEGSYNEKRGNFFYYLAMVKIPSYNVFYSFALLKSQDAKGNVSLFSSALLMMREGEHLEYLECIF